MADSIDKSLQKLNAQLPPAASNSSADLHWRQDFLRDQARSEDPRYQKMFETMGIKTNQDLLNEGQKVADNLKNGEKNVNESADKWFENARQADAAADRMKKMSDALEKRADRLGSYDGNNTYPKGNNGYPTRNPATVEAGADYPDQKASKLGSTDTKQPGDITKENAGSNAKKSSSEANGASGKGGKIAVAGSSEELKVKELLEGKRDGSSAADILAAAKEALAGLKDKYGNMDPKALAAAGFDAETIAKIKAHPELADAIVAKHLEAMQNGGNESAGDGFGETQAQLQGGLGQTLFERVHNCYQRQASL